MSDRALRRLAPAGTSPGRGLLGLGLLVAVLLTAPSLHAQPVIDPVERLDFDAPESWGMKWFASASLLTGLGPVRSVEPGRIDLGFEAISVPHLSREERRIGFDGQKVEDLNRSPVYGRLRARFGLPASFSLTVAWIPPVTVDGVTANLLSLAVERPVWERGRDAVGLRLFGQTGTAEGDLTCSSDDIRFEPGAPGNEFGCQERSDDEVTLDYVGLEVVGSHRFGGGRGPVVHAGVSGQYMDLEFQVDALTFGFRDRTLQLTDGWTGSITAGGTFRLRERWSVTVEAFYTPLWVRRPPERERENDGLLDARVLLRWRVR